MSNTKYQLFGGICTEIVIIVNLIQLIKTNIE
jgi:hypothetical protein